MLKCLSVHEENICTGCYLKELCPYLSSRGYLKYCRMLVACATGLQKLYMHNWGVVNSVWYIISTVGAHCLALAWRRGTKEFVWPLEWFVVCVIGCIDTRG